jgi:hypothetical protein
MEYPAVNMIPLEKSRKRLKAGDIFVVQMRPGEYVFGRVISITAACLPMKDCLLLYFYRSFSDHKDKIPPLDCQDLLFPPVMTNRLGWSRGYFETVAHRPLEPGDVLEHCFEHLSGRYFDDKGNEIARSEPCGAYVFHSYASLDDEISEALGIPLVPDDD